jgi:hypothetical protein
MLLQLIKLSEGNPQQSAQTYLEQAIGILSQHLHPDLIVGYQLIPETGGVPRMPAIYTGELLNPAVTRLILQHGAYIGTLGRLIRQWELCFEACTDLDDPDDSEDEGDYARLLKAEEIGHSVFIPLPLYHPPMLAALLLHYRDRPALDKARQSMIHACSVLMGNRLAHIRRLQYSGEQTFQKAAAHTIYDKVANTFKVQIDLLEAAIINSLGTELPDTIVSQLAAARLTVFTVMRDLVIQAAEDVLIDLKTMSLSQVLNSTTTALMRGWPDQHKVMIELSTIPKIIDAQPLKLRQILYALVLEAVGNAIRHGGPAKYIHVEVDWNWLQSQVEIMITDHGQGFKVDPEKFSRFGLGFWHRYIEQNLAGEFNVSGGLGYNTVVRATIPVIPARSQLDDEHL